MAYGDSPVVGVSGHVGRQELQQQLHRSMPGLVVCVCATRHAKSTTDVKTLNFKNKCCVKKCFPSYLHVPELFEFSGVFLVWMIAHMGAQKKS